MKQTGIFLYAALTLVTIWLVGAACQAVGHAGAGSGGASVNAGQPSGTAAGQTPAGMVYVEGGTFMMGDTFGDGFDAEKPAHRVTVNGFYIAQYEVTFAEYEAFCEATGGRTHDDLGYGRGSRPVIDVTWYDAVDYCNWRSRQEGLTPAYVLSGTTVSCDFTSNGYRLPTEAEWEYAAKGGKNGRGYKYSGGNDIDVVGWYKGNSGKMTHPVGQKQPNELGLYDMSGNVSEWCWDRYSIYYYQHGDSLNPLGTGPSHRVKRAIRGGGWHSNDICLRASWRDGANPGLGDVGFRLLRSL